VVGALAALVPRPTVPPGAGNEAKKARKAESKRVEKGAKDYVEAIGLDRHLDTATVRRHDDDDSSAVPTITIEQHDLRERFAASGCPRCPGSLAGIVDASTTREPADAWRDRFNSEADRLPATGPFRSAAQDQGTSDRAGPGTAYWR
jgi:hypothetical protein